MSDLPASGAPKRTILNLGALPPKQAGFGQNLVGHRLLHCSLAACSFDLSTRSTLVPLRGSIPTIRHGLPTEDITVCCGLAVDRCTFFSLNH